MITIKEIAAAAGVTPTTVSNVIHGKVKKVSPQMVEKIQALLQEHNYIPRFGLNALTNRGSKIIGILVNTPDFFEYTPFERPFYGTVIGALEYEFRKRGYYIMILSSKDVPEMMRMVLGWNVDGVISISMPKRYYQEIEELTGKPVVSIDLSLEKDEDVGICYNVASKDYEAAADLMERLINQGIRKMVYLNNVMVGSDYQRYMGFQDTCVRFLGPGKSFESIVLGRTYEERETIYQKLGELVGQNAVLLFSTDFYAVEAIGYYSRHQIRVPEDISIVGFDDDIHARLSVPRLTTIRIDSVKKAEYAAAMLMDLIEGREVAQRNLKIATEFVERESVKRRSAGE